MTFDNWIQSGKDLVVKGTGHQFAIADWLLEGGERWEEKAYAKAEEITGFTRQTLYDYVSTARAFPPESRKYASASFNHYRAVAPVADPEKRHYFMVQAVACTVAELRRKVSPPLASKQKSEREVKGDKPITVIVSGFERSVLADLATLRGVDISAIVRPLITGYVEKSDINTEWLRGGKQLKQKREEKLQARREKWAKATHESIQNLIEEYDQREGPFPLPIDFVHGWQNRTGRRFTARVFNFAMEHTELGHHCGTKNRGAYGLPVASGRKSCGKGRKYVPTTSKEVVKRAYSNQACEQVRPFLLGLSAEWQDLESVRNAVRAQCPLQEEYFTAGFRRAVRALKKEGKVQVEKEQIRKTEVAA